MATDRKGKVGLTIRRKNNKPKNASSNDASKLKELNSAFESSKNKNKINSNNEKPAKKEKKEKNEKKAKKTPKKSRLVN